MTVEYGPEYLVNDWRLVLVGALYLTLFLYSGGVEVVLWIRRRIRKGEGSRGRGL